ncbi:unnamed protein product [Medioppia subpectinata]|uniref:Nuclear receptor domain-containing protein n=1 Tax=Medioppia subpectinata TaxID=1979941 RepID=A0A7R9KHR3_9ACAR|nr:unnamed protein product [Medioppia subpectinata]CAG2103685.1 unnamed protein product [Medioppia subpectinata]
MKGNKLSELFQALKVLQSSDHFNDYSIVGNCVDALSIIIGKIDSKIQNVVKMSRRLTDFNSICQNDQIVLLKYSSIEIDIMRMVLRFNFQDKSHLIRLSLFEGLVNPKLFLENMGLDWDSEPLIIDLLTAIILFNPHRPHLIHKHTIKYQQNIYIYLLKRNHYNAISCESCKSFFRRNSLKNDRFRCYLGGKCQIDVHKRGLCKKCRLDKCFDVGMKTSLFYSNEEIQLRNTFIAGNRKRKHRSIAESTPVVNLPQLLDLSIDSLPSSTQNKDILILDNIGIDINCNQINNFDNEVMNSVIPVVTPDELNQSVIPIMRPISDYSNTFNELEGNRLTELLSALKNIDYMMSGNKSSNIDNYIINDIREATELKTKINEIIFKDTVKVCKALNAFKYLSLSDQMVLFKYSAPEIMVLRMVLGYNFEHNYWSIVIKLTAIILFNPNRSKLNNKSMIK